MQERLQKILSARGIASRRKAEEYILAGLVKVNGEIAVLGQKADAMTDQIEVDGRVLQDRIEMLYYVMNKPVGVETTNVERDASESERMLKKPVPKITPAITYTPSVRDVLPKELQGKIFPVGRLDKDSSGLLLFTNDGVLAYRLTHPSFQHEKEYEVLLDRPIEPIACRKIEEGFEMDGHKTKPLKCGKVAPSIIHIVLTEGKNRQIRRMCQHVGYTVRSLKRIRIMTLMDSMLPAGQIRMLTKDEKKALLRSVGL
ncbi:rRNA pseudouridine synthase [Candidatus Peribacteria bacterium]|nr:rRNA pseudouridine synthase [Candidatus Peribacteria bacterium]